MRYALARLIARNSGWLIALLALAGLAIAAYILFFAGPISLPTDMSDRAPIGGSVGGLFALLAAIVAISAAMWINSSDFKAEQAVKQDSAILRASLRMILIKGAVINQSGQPANPADAFKQELAAIGSFVNSTTGFGYWSHVEHRSDDKEAEGGGAEDWRIFFLNIALLLEAGSEPGKFNQLMHCAAWLEELLATLTTSDIDGISRYVSNLTGALGKARASNDVVLQGMAATYGRGSKFDPVASAGKKP